MKLSKAPTRTSDRVNVGTKVTHHTSHAAVKAAAPGSGVLHPGQPKNLAGKGFSAGQSKTNSTTK
jgi:hypothetical protein